jgi:tight adherence protein C
MILKVAAVSSFLWFIFIAFLLQLKQTPEAQLRKRLNQMIDQAEATRLKNPKKKKNATPTILPADVNNFLIDPPQQRVSFKDRVIRPFVQFVEERLQKLAPQAIKEQIEDKIFRAGKTGSWSATRLIAGWCFSLAVFSFGTVVFLQQHAGLNLAQRFLVICLGVFVGAAIPFAVLNAKIRQRQKNIRKQLPEFLDLLCVSVQAGLSFDGAVSKMIKRMKGPLIDEFSRMQQDVALGMTHQYALTNLAQRCDLEEIYLFTTSIIQAEKLGTSMTRTLKTQADNMRDRHRQWVKTEAMKAPVKILFPMILFIFPSMFVVLLFPALYALMQNLSNR